MRGGSYPSTPSGGIAIKMASTTDAVRRDVMFGTPLPPLSSERGGSGSAAEETRLRRAARGDDDDDDKTGSQEIELLAERSPEELEAEKVEQAKRDGNFFNLADSQPVDEDGPTMSTQATWISVP